jgi:O-methyltransferase
MKYTGDIISTDANNSFMMEDKFIKCYEDVKKTDTRGYLGNYDIRWRIHTILWASDVALKKEGDFVDCGGGFGYFLSSIYSYFNFEESKKKYYMLDSFEGLDLSTSSKEEIHNHNISFAKIGNWYDDILKNHGNKKNLKIIKGFIPNTLSEVDTEKISFLSIDLNSVKPEVECLNAFWDKVVKGGIVVFDDYGFPGCEKQRDAHNEFAKSKGRMVMSSPTGQGILIK